MYLVENTFSKWNQKGWEISYWRNKEDHILQKLNDKEKELDKKVKMLQKNTAEVVSMRNKRSSGDKRKCFSCGRLGHIANVCPDGDKGRKCFTCNQFGHERKDCNNKTVENNTRERLCYKCLKPGHEFKKCPNEIVCRHCHKEGHKVNDCSEK